MLDVIGGRKKRVRAAMLIAQAGEIPAHIDQLPGDDMNDPLLALQRAAHTQ